MLWFGCHDDVVVGGWWLVVGGWSLVCMCIANKKPTSQDVGGLLPACRFKKKEIHTNRGQLNAPCCKNSQNDAKLCKLIRI
jgi:hypothetical protein